MAEPIMEFTDIAQAYKCLKEWQTKLFLDDWIIKLQIIPFDEMQTFGHIGENEYQTTNKCACISIGVLTENAKTAMSKVPQELTLVHELLHCKFIMTDGMKDTIDGLFISSYEHTLIEQMAKSLIMAKYNLTFEWFKNF